MMTLRLACAAATGDRNVARKRTMIQFRPIVNRSVILGNTSTLHPLFLVCAANREVNGSRFGMGRKFSEAPPHLPGSLHGYQKKEITKGVIYKCLKKKGTKSSGEGSATRSRMGIVGTHPAVFVRAASNGLTGYGTWQSAQALE